MRNEATGSEHEAGWARLPLYQRSQLAREGLQMKVCQKIASSTYATSTGKKTLVAVFRKYETYWTMRLMKMKSVIEFLISPMAT